MQQLKPRLLVPVKVWQKLLAFVKACPVEIAGYGYIEQIETNELVLKDVFILDQFVTSVSTDPDTHATARHLSEMVQRGEDPSTIKFQWHSHADGGVFYSGTDTHTIDNAYLAPWMISMVLNRHEEHTCRIDFFDDCRLAFDLEVSVFVPHDDQLKKFVEQEISAKLKQPVTGWFGRKKLQTLEPVYSENGYSLLGGDYIER